jgi:hypothetical protein
MPVELGEDVGVSLKPSRPAQSTARAEGRILQSQCPPGRVMRLPNDCKGMRPLTASACLRAVRVFRGLDDGFSTGGDARSQEES